MLKNIQMIQKKEEKRKQRNIIDKRNRKHNKIVDLNQTISIIILNVYLKNSN